MSHKKSKLDKKKAKYFSMYMSWGEVFCPALKANVLFTRMGWNHICETKWRTGPEQGRRLEILPLSKKLIGLTTTIQAVRYMHEFASRTYEFNAWMDGVYVVAVVSEKNGKYYFLSNFRP